MNFFTGLLTEKLRTEDRISDENRFYGLFGAGKAFFLREISERTGEKMLVVAKSELSARKFYEDLSFLCGSENVLLIEPAEYMLYDAFPTRVGGVFQRTASLFKLLRGEFKVAVTSPASLMDRLPKGEKLLEKVIRLKKDDESDPVKIIAKLAEMGYTRAFRTEEQGQFSLRGDILDVFPFGSEAPVRCEFFDTVIESLRNFDPLTQRTSEEIDEVEILPDKETTIFGKYDAERIKKAMTAAAETIRDRGLRRRIIGDAERIAPGAVFRGSDRYIYFNIGDGVSLFDYAGDILTVAEEPSEIEEVMKSTIEDHYRVCDSIRDTTGLLKETYMIYKDPAEVRDEIRARRGFELCQFGGDSKNETQVRQKEISSLTDGVLTESEFLTQETKKGKTIIYYADSDGRVRRLSELLKDAGATVVRDVSKAQKGLIAVEKGGLSTSFEFPDAGLEVITENALTGQNVRKSRKKIKGASENPLTFSDLSIGDIVVHDVHGIGRYEGLVSMIADGVRGDYVKITYRDDGVIYVPAHRLSEIRKYIGNDGSPPVLNKLGSHEWEKMTSRVKESLRVYARELVELYAKRSTMQGFAFSADSVWQKEFEEEFPYDETADQIKCVEEIKNDMELPRPMDRLLCGDVGYGKTEVALRAAFKAICDGKQVIFLVPTTVLTMQHYNTFKERFKNYPVKVAAMSRLNTEKEKKQIAEELRKGVIDILVGTHSIILRKLNFKDPGLLIIDEEQRFGVKQKEKIKEMYPGIDILTLSATPIPRTLHMSLSGIRDISIIDDPPKNRVPVKTYVAEWDPIMIKNAIYREMGRHGQVFYLHNDIDTINDKALQLQEMIPEARICVGNGKMDERELEDVLSSFIDGKYDILVCTTIIESGIDMPNVNTVIVENGDRLGLAQLYQIRGRVGRSERPAYAYITYPGGKEISETAEKRLRTIREYTDFGAGFKIAMKDLEIRGAGSVLGERQHGQIAVVGYEMYCRLLGEVVEETKTGEAVTLTKPSSNVDIKIAAYISEDYIEDEESRVSIYRSISAIESEDDIEDLTNDMTDRFGKVPAETLRLMQISYIRCLAESKQISSVVRRGDFIFFMLDDSAPAQSLSEIGNYATRIFGRKVNVGVGKSPYVSLRVSSSQKDDPPDVIIENVKKILFCPKK